MLIFPSSLLVSSVKLLDPLLLLQITLVLKALLLDSASLGFLPLLALASLLILARLVLTSLLVQPLLVFAVLLILTLLILAPLILALIPVGVVASVPTLSLRRSIVSLVVVSIPALRVDCEGKGHKAGKGCKGHGFPKFHCRLLFVPLAALAGRRLLTCSTPVS